MIAPENTLKCEKTSPMAGYFPTFLGFFSGAGFALGGRPLPGEAFTSSRVFSGYSASLEMGLIPALTILWRAAKYDSSKASATSWIVTPVMVILSALYEKNIKCSNSDTFYYTFVKLKSQKNKKMLNLRYILLDINVQMVIHL